MGFPVEKSGRVSQGTYWVFFGAMMILVPGLLFGGGSAVLRGSLGTGLLMIAAIVPMGLYWRVIMMRRCRDIGWPAFLPWLSFGLQFFGSYSVIHGLQNVRYGAAPSPAIMSMPLLMAFADFAFSIVIGCIRSKEAFDYTAVFGDGPGSHDQRLSQPSGSRQPMPMQKPSLAGDEGGDRYDAAIARALEAHRRGESLIASPPPPSSTPPVANRPASGFGRRIV